MKRLKRNVETWTDAESVVGIVADADEDIEVLVHFVLGWPWQCLPLLMAG